MSDFAGMAIGSRIKARREKLGLQQKDLAERLECAQSTVSDWESGAMNPRSDKLTAIAKVLKCDVAELLA